jgi:hypothetical protein
MYLYSQAYKSRYSRLSWVALNPQPLPPGPPDRLSLVALNPQPLPPGPPDAFRIAALRTAIR